MLDHCRSHEAQMVHCHSIRHLGDLLPRIRDAKVDQRSRHVIHMNQSRDLHRAGVLAQLAQGCFHHEEMLVPVGLR